MNLRFNPGLRAVIAERLVSFEWRRRDPEDRHQAAVVLAIVPGEDGEAAVVLTRRASGLRRHSGQFALPGGRIDDGETPAEAALRELDEEVGLRLAPDQILGTLDDYVTRSGFFVRPHVAWAGAGEMTPEPGEVAAIYRVPLADLARPDALVDTRFFAGEPIPALYLEIVGGHLFPPTAAILHQFAELAVHGRRTAVDHLPQPAFTWK
ncbi:MAG: CoA pyrophosphatase [Thermoanaerobaculia bacterium]